MERLAYLCLSTAWGGLEMNQLRAAIQMQKRGHNVLLIANANSPIAKEAASLHIPLYIIKQKAKHYQWRFAWKLCRYLKRENFTQLIFRNNREQSIAASVAFLSFRKIQVHYFMEMAIGGKRTQFFRSLRYAFFSTWVCPLPYLKEQVLANTQMHIAKIKTIPSGISFEALQILSKTAARQQLSWPLDQKIIAMVGRIDPKKRQRFVWESFSKRSPSNEYLIFVGEHTLDESDHYAFDLKKDIEAHQKNDKIIWAGFQTDMAAIYSAADVVVMASEFETVGMATLEALQYGCPVLGSNNGGSKAIIDQFGGGLCFESTNMNAFNHCIDQIFEKDYPSLKKQEFEQHFAFEHVCGQIEAEVLGL